MSHYLNQWWSSLLPHACVTWYIRGKLDYHCKQLSGQGYLLTIMLVISINIALAFNISLLLIFSCDQAALQMVFSVCLSVCPSVRLSHLFDYVPIIVSSWNFQELSHWTRVRSMQKVKVRGQRSRSQRSRPNFSFPDCNSSLNSHMMMKWYT